MVTKSRSPEGDDRYVMSRTEDRSIWAKSAFVLEKYKVLVWIAFVAAVAVGFEFKTPGMIVKELQTQITKNKINVDSTVVPRVDSLRSDINILLKLRCIDPKLTPEQRTLVGLNCNEVFRSLSR